METLRGRTMATQALVSKQQRESEISSKETVTEMDGVDAQNRLRSGEPTPITETHRFNFISEPNLREFVYDSRRDCTLGNLAYTMAPSIQLSDGRNGLGFLIHEAFCAESNDEDEGEAEDSLGDIEAVSIRVSRHRVATASTSCETPTAATSLFFTPAKTQELHLNSTSLKKERELSMAEFSAASETFDDSQDEIDLLSMYNSSSRPLSLEVVDNGNLKKEPSVVGANGVRLENEEEVFNQRPSQCPTPRAGAIGRTSIDTNSLSHDDDRNSIASETSSSITIGLSSRPRLLSNGGGWDMSNRNSASSNAGANATNPMKVRKSFMSTVSTSSSVASAHSKSGSARHGVGPFWTSREHIQQLELQLDGMLLLRMDFRADIPDYCVEDEDDYGIVSSGPGIDLSMQFVEASFELDDGVKCIKSGSLHTLVTHLWANPGTPTEQNQKFIVEFLQTYRYFATAEDVARLLILGYLEIEWSNDRNHHVFHHTHCDFFDALSESLATGAGGDWAGFLQLRVLNVFKKWIDLHPDDFVCNKSFCDFVCLFLERKVERDEKRAKHATSILGNLRDKLKDHELSAYLVVPALPSLTPSNARLGSAMSKSQPSLSLLGQKCRAHSEGPQSTADASSPTLKQSSSSWSLRRKFTFRKESNKSTDTLASNDSWKSTGSPSFSLNLFHSRSASTQDSPIAVSDGAMSIAAALAEIAPPSKRLSELDPSAVAKQLTLLEHNHFRKIKLEEFYMQSWSKKMPASSTISPNGSITPPSKARLVAFINWFNRVAYGVATEVVKINLVKERVTMLKRFIFIAELCVKWNNFNTAFEIVAGLNLGPVSRLNKTWKALPAKYIDAWTKLNRIVSSEGSYRAYRHLIAQIKEQSSGTPVLPYLGVNLSDLTFTEDGNPSFLAHDPSSGEKTVNFSKFRMVSKILCRILKSQVGQYDFEYDDMIQRWLRTDWEALSSKDLYELSLACEPRVLPT